MEDPAVSKDGSQIAFASDARGVWEIWIFRRDDGDLRSVARGRDPDWSPDGKKLVFEGAREESGQIHEVDLESGSVRALTDPGAGKRDREPRYSPDGTQIAFGSDRSGSDQLWRMSASGQSPAQVTHGPLSLSGPAWSPTGRELVVSGCAFAASSSDCALHVVNASDGSLRKLTPQGSLMLAADWSNEGIVFNADGRSTYQLWVIAPDGTGLRPFAEVEHLTEPRWDPRTGSVLVTQFGNNDSRLGIARAGSAPLQPIAGLEERLFAIWERHWRKP